jgi:hypothetical protein
MSAPVGGGGARYGRLCLRLAHWGCANRPFYHIVVAKRSFPNRRYIDPIEQVALEFMENIKQCCGSLFVSIRMRIRIQHFLSMRIRAQDPGFWLPKIGK